MKAKQVVLLAILVLVAALVGWLALRTRQPPLLPRDMAHASFVGAERCLTCHGPAGSHPQSRNHPLGRECLRCHGFK